MAGEFGEITTTQIGTGDDPDCLHLGRSHRPDAVETLYRKSGDERRSLLAADDAQPVGLVLV